MSVKIFFKKAFGGKSELLKFPFTETGKGQGHFSHDLPVAHLLNERAPLWVLQAEKRHLHEFRLFQAEPDRCKLGLCDRRGAP